MLEEAPLGLEVSGEKRASIHRKFALLGLCIALVGTCGVVVARRKPTSQSEISSLIPAVEGMPLQTIGMNGLAPVNVDLKIDANFLKEGLDVYDKVKDDMKELLGYDGFAKQMGTIIHIMGDLDKYLKPAEKKAARKLANAQASALEAMTEARVTILTIHQGAVVLQLILTQHDPEGEKVRAALALWINNAKSVQQKIDKAKEAVKKATRDILEARASLQPIVSALRRFTHDVQLEEDKAKAHAHDVCTARGFIGALAGPVGLVVGQIISQADCAFKWIPQLEKAYDDQTKEVESYKQTFKTMNTKLTVWDGKVTKTRNQLADVEAKCALVTDTAKTQQIVHAPVVFKALVFSVEQLVKSSTIETVEQPR